MADAAAPEPMMKPHDEIYQAEQRIRSVYRYPDPMHDFMSGVADWMNDMAMRGMHGTIGGPGNITWSKFNSCLRTARAYNNYYEKRKGEIHGEVTAAQQG